MEFRSSHPASISVKFDRGQSLRGRQMQAALGQNRSLSTNNWLYLENGTR